MSQQVSIVNNNSYMTHYTYSSCFNLIVWLILIVFSEAIKLYVDPLTLCDDFGVAVYVAAREFINFVYMCNIEMPQ